jgi:protein-tyrosine phosphatase
MRILFVCMGNICRSPTAEGVMRHVVEREGLSDTIEVESAGTGGWHVGDAPDERATAAARARGITMEGEARQFTVEDFDDFDLILAMDEQNRRDILRLAGDDEQRAKVRMFREFDPASRDDANLDVPDPYYGGKDGFEHVLDLVEAAAEGLVAEARAWT